MNGGRFLPVLTGIIIGSAACAPSPAPILHPQESEAPPTPSIAPPPAEVGWTSRPNVEMELPEGGSIAVMHPFARMELIQVDSVGLLVRCSACPGVPLGYLAEDDLVLGALPPEVAAWSGLAEFALSIRDAAESHDLQALRPVMAYDFSFGFIGMQTIEHAFSAWIGENFVTLTRLPALLDRGLASRDGRIWTAPPEFLTDPGYSGLRAGFRRRADGRWEWIYLIQGVGDR
jgi:hypothetical protein